MLSQKLSGFDVGSQHRVSDIFAAVETNYPSFDLDRNREEWVDGEEKISIGKSARIVTITRHENENDLDWLIGLGFRLDNALYEIYYQIDPDQ